PMTRNSQAEMNLEAEQLLQELEQALESLAETKGAGFVYQLRPILLTNLERGRVQKSIGQDTASLSAYVGRVAACFSTLSPYLYQLEVEQNRETWMTLFVRMQTWAYNFFLRRNFSADAITLEIAAECATEASMTLLRSHFPYDTDFDPWAHV